jgi:hypothetical protein
VYVGFYFDKRFAARRTGSTEGNALGGALEGWVHKHCRFEEWMITPVITGMVFP